MSEYYVPLFRIRPLNIKINPSLYIPNRYKHNFVMSTRRENDAC